MNPTDNVTLPTLSSQLVNHLLTKLSFRVGELSIRKFHMPSSLLKDLDSESLGYNIPGSFDCAFMKKVNKIDKNINAIETVTILTDLQSCDELD